MLFCRCGRLCQVFFLLLLLFSVSSFLVFSFFCCFDFFFNTEFVQFRPCLLFCVVLRLLFLSFFLRVLVFVRVCVPVLFVFVYAHVAHVTPLRSDPPPPSLPSAFMQDGSGDIDTSLDFKRALPTRQLLVHGERQAEAGTEQGEPRSVDAFVAVKAGADACVMGASNPCELPS